MSKVQKKIKASSKNAIPAKAGSKRIYPLLSVLVISLLLYVLPARAGWQMEANIPTINQLRGIDGYDENSIFAVGNYGTILKYDQTAWQNSSGITEKTVFGVWWASGSEAFAVCDKGIILHYNGTDWAIMDSGTTQRLRDIWGTAPDDIFAVGENGTLLHYDGTIWEIMTSPTLLTLQSVWGSSASEVYAVGGASGSGGTGSGVIINYDGRQWMTMTEFVIPRLQDVWGEKGKTVFAVGESGTIFSLTPGNTTWDSMESGTTETLRDVWGISEQNVYAAGDYGTILHYDGASWFPVVSGTTMDMFGIWGSSKNNIFAVGRDGVVLHYTDASDDNSTSICPFLVSIDSQDDIKLLRDFRDIKLRNHKGLDLMTLFYKNSAEAAEIIKRDPGLRQKLAAFVAGNRHFLTAIISGNSVSITMNMVIEITAFLREIQSRGSTKFATAIDGVLNGIEHGRLLDLIEIQVQ
jgi:hypothetical protein